MTIVTIITGASGGFGKEFAKLFAANGNNLLLIARSREKLLQLQKKLEKRYAVRVLIMEQDLSKENATKKVKAFAKEQELQVETLVNNAGFGDYGKFADTDLEKQIRMIHLNDRALVELTHLFLPDILRLNTGGILNVASVAAFEAGPMMSVYYASKAFVLSFTEALSIECKDTNLHITALCPGPSNTGFRNAAQVPSGRFANMFSSGKPEKIAKCGYHGWKSGKVIVIPGILNKLAILLVKFLPRAITGRVLYFIQS